MYLLGNEKYFCKMPAIKCIQNYSLCLQCATNFSNLIRILARITLSKINIRSNKINDICVSFPNRKSRFGGIKVVGGKARYCQNREETRHLQFLYLAQSNFPRHCSISRVVESSVEEAAVLGVETASRCSSSRHATTCRRLVRIRRAGEIGTRVPRRPRASRNCSATRARVCCKG